MYDLTGRDESLRKRIERMYRKREKAWKKEFGGLAGKDYVGKPHRMDLIDEVVQAGLEVLESHDAR
jgi:hypothetical protein